MLGNEDKVQVCNLSLSYDASDMCGETVLMIGAQSTGLKGQECGRAKFTWLLPAVRAFYITSVIFFSFDEAPRVVVFSVTFMMPFFRYVTSVRCRHSSGHGEHGSKVLTFSNSFKRGTGIYEEVVRI